MTNEQQQSSRANAPPEADRDQTDAHGEDSRHKQRRALVQLAIGAVTISFAPVFVRLIEVTPTASAFYRVLMGGIMLLALVFIRRRTRPSGRTGQSPKPRLYAGPIALFASVLAGAMFALDLFVWHRSIWYVGPGLATLLGNFQVFALALAGIFFFGERASWHLAVAIPVAMAGLLMIVGVDWNTLSSDYRWGVIYGLLTATAYAAYILSLRWAHRTATTDDAARDLAVASLIAAVFLALIMLAEGASFRLPSVDALGLIFCYALVAQVLGWLLITGSLKYVPASRVGLVLLLQPSLAFVWDVLIFARPFSPREAIGAALALAAIYLGSRARR